MIRRLPIVALVPILLVAAFFRFDGLHWDAAMREVEGLPPALEEQHLHPDERFLTMVTSSLEFPASVSEYFDTEISTLNPHNRGHGFFAYGTLPLFLVRAVAGSVRRRRVRPGAHRRPGAVSGIGAGHRAPAVRLRPASLWRQRRAGRRVPLLGRRAADPAGALLHRRRVHQPVRDARATRRGDGAGARLALGLSRVRRRPRRGDGLQDAGVHDGAGAGGGGGVPLHRLAARGRSPARPPGRARARP